MSRVSRFTLPAVAVVLLALLAIAVPASGQSNLPWNATPMGSHVLSTHAAYDDKHDVYLQVASGGDGTAVMGRFVGATGESLGSPFVVGTRRNNFSGAAKVAYSRGTADDVFLVIYWSDANGASVVAQRVRYTGNGTTGGSLVGDFIAVSPFSLTPACVSKPNDVVYNPATRAFLIAYEESDRGGCGYGGSSVDIMVRAFGSDGSALAGPVNVSSGTGAQVQATIAVDWQRNLFIVAFTGDRPGTEDGVFPGVFGKIFDAATFLPTSTLQCFRCPLSGSAIPYGNVTNAAAAYLPELDAFLLVFSDLESSRIVGQYLLTTTTTEPVSYIGFFVSDASLKTGSPSVLYDPATRSKLVVGWNPPNVVRLADSGLGGFLRSGAYLPTVHLAENGYFAVSYVAEDGTAGLGGYRTTPSPTPGPHFISSDVRAAIESPVNGATQTGTFSVTGYALDTHATTGCGVDGVDVFIVPAGSAPIYLSRATSFSARPDVRTALALPAQFSNCGFSVNSAALPAGNYTVLAYPHSAVTGQFTAPQLASISVPSQPYSYIDTPANNSTQSSAFTVSGWALDLGASSGPGVDAIHMWVFRVGGGVAPQFFLGTQTARPDVAAAVGSSQFTNSGFTANITGLTSGMYDIVVYARSTVTGAFNPRVVRVMIP